MRLIVPNFNPKTTPSSEDGNLARIYIEFDDLIYPDGSSYRENQKKISLISLFQKQFADDKPMQIPIYVGELARAVQE